MQNIFIKILFLFSSLFFVACGTSPNSTGSSNSLVVETQKAVLFSGTNQLSLDLKVSSAYDDSVEIDLSKLTLDVTPCIVQSAVFRPSTVSFKENKSENVNALVSFTDTCTPESYVFSASAGLTLNGKSKESLFSSSSLAITPTVVDSVSDTNGTGGKFENNESNNDTLNYKILFSLEDETMKLNLNEKKSFKVALVDKESSRVINNERITSFNIIASHPSILQLSDRANQVTGTNQLTYTGENDLVFYMETNTRSGFCDIVVKVDYIDDQGENQLFVRTYGVTVLSGVPTTFSINDKGVVYNAVTKWFEQELLISASDKYNNPVNISPTIYVNAMTGFAKDSSNKEILYGKNSTISGNLIADTATQTAQLETGKSLFSGLDPARDYLLLFGDNRTFEALGKWDIDFDQSSDSMLSIKEAYHGENHEGLGFAVGHNYIEEICRSDYREWHLLIDSSDGSYQLDEEGKASVKLRYPAEYLYGKRVAISVNFLGNNPETGKTMKSGEVYFKVLNNVEGLEESESVAVPKDLNNTLIRHYGVINTGTGDRFSLKNSNFSCFVKTTGSVTFQQLTPKNPIKNFSECETQGGNTFYLELSYVEYSVSGGSEGGTFQLTDCYVNSLEYKPF